MKAVVRQLTEGLLLVVVLVGATAQGRAEAWSLSTLGTRGGFSANDKSTSFELIEVLGTFDMPWRWRWESGWQVQSRLAFSAGRLHGRDDQGFAGTVGPNLILGYKEFPLHLELGISPTVLSEWEYDTMDFGTPFQFTSYAGVDIDVSKHLGFGYRYQHMSNAHFSNHNPGLNLHAFAIYYRF